MKLTVAKVDSACPVCGAAVKGGLTTVAVVNGKSVCVTCAGKYRKGVTPARP